ncbi:hypothetical protein P8452_60607 [Trifolium repens]|nr:hypothetical protein P8452_60607 [Trifolium repens]
MRLCWDSISISISSIYQLSSFRRCGEREINSWPSVSTFWSSQVAFILPSFFHLLYFLNIKDCGFLSSCFVYASQVLRQREIK